MVLTEKQTQILYAAIIFGCLFPFVSPALALITGIVLSLVGIKSERLSGFNSLALKASIVFMGFGMSLTQVISASKTGFGITAISVISTLIAGMVIAYFLKVDKQTGLLISAGTAICGGSAIAAVAPVINARDHQISFSLLVVFVLNSVALFIFPLLGHYFNLSQETFGYWAAIAIHDTSSVVGASSEYGPKALEIATTVKLTRALWIIPVSLSLAFFNKNKSGKVQIPWFIGLFILSIVISNLLPQWNPTFANLNWLGKRGMVIALFLIGSNISFGKIKEAGFKSFAVGILLWVIVATSSFVLIRAGIK